MVIDRAEILFRAENPIRDSAFQIGIRVPDAIGNEGTNTARIASSITIRVNRIRRRKGTKTQEYVSLRNPEGYVCWVSRNVVAPTPRNL